MKGKYETQDLKLDRIFRENSTQGNFFLFESLVMEGKWQKLEKASNTFLKN